jgi:cystathionine beta-lyase
VGHYNFDELPRRRGTSCEKWDTYPEDVLPMWVADSDFHSPPEISSALLDRVRLGVFGYSCDEPRRFEKAAVLWMRKRFSWEVDPSGVEFTPSVCTALAMAIQAYSRPGDKVLFQTPIYPPFRGLVQANKRLPLASPLLWKDGNYRIDFEDLESKLADPAVTLFLLCNPHNPTGRAFTREELLRMGELCLKHGVLIFSDEIHCDYVFARHGHIPFPSLGPEFARISAMAINPSKTFNIADLRTAAVLLPHEDMRAPYRRTLRGCSLGRSSLGLLAFCLAYERGDAYADEVRLYVEGNIDYALSHIEARIPEIGAYKPEATYLLWLDCRKFGLEQDGLFSFFLDKAKLALSSGDIFGEEGKGFMRLNLACPRSLVEEALGRLERAVRER